MQESGRRGAALAGGVTRLPVLGSHPEGRVIAQAGGIGAVEVADRWSARGEVVRVKNVFLGAGVAVLLILTAQWWVPLLQLNVCR